MDADRIVQAERNVMAVRMTIRRCEGTDAPAAYRALFGYHPVRNPLNLFDSFHDHPRRRFTFKRLDGTMGITTAAGAYQVTETTYDDMVRRYGKEEIPDFTPQTQDHICDLIIKEQRAWADCACGNIVVALTKLAPRWASLPASNANQPKRQLDFALAAFASYGGTFSDGAIA